MAIDRPSLKEIILLQVDEEDIFRFYLGQDFKIGKAIKSPFRKENHPSFNIFKTEDNKVLYNDFAYGSGDCFKFVMELYGCSFKEAINKIAVDFNIDTQSGIAMSLSLTRKYKEIPKIIKQDRAEIQYTTRDWNQEDDKYWGQANIDRTHLTMFNYIPICAYSVRKDGIWKAVELHNEIAYAILIGDGIKIYRPNAAKKNRYLGNTRKEDIFGLDVLEDVGHQLLVGIVAGQKDAVAMYANFGIYCIAFNAESIKMNEDIFLTLNTLSDNLFVCYDNDDAGIRYSKRIEEDFGIHNVYIGEYTEENDIFDGVKNDPGFKDKFKELVH